jgi:hypothetical protein
VNASGYVSDVLNVLNMVCAKFSKHDDDHNVDGVRLHL